MFPIGDDNPPMRTPVVTIALLAVIGAVWLIVQGAGLDEVRLASSVCVWGMVPGELTGRAPVGLGAPIAPGLACVVDRDALNVLTPVTHQFLHGGWAHILGNALFLWIFGNNVEDVMGRLRFVVFYVVCGLAAATAQVLVSPGAAVPMVGASGAISGVLGAYLMLYPRAPVRVLFVFIVFVELIVVPAYFVLLWWIAFQLIAALPQLREVDDASRGGVAFWAHVGGFGAGVLLVRLFVNRELLAARVALGRRPVVRRRWTAWG
jgi:membrane associated rhomboid family serine protease